MAQLTLTHAADSAARMRVMDVLVDGQVVAQLRRDTSATIEVPVGVVRVKASMDWASSRELQVEVPDAGEEVVVALPFSSIFKIFYRAHDAIRIDVRPRELPPRHM